MDFRAWVVEEFDTAGDEREGFDSTGEFGLLFLVSSHRLKTLPTHIHNPLVRALMLGGCVEMYVS